MGVIGVHRRSDTATPTPHPPKLALHRFAGERPVLLGAVTRGEADPPDDSIRMLAGMITSEGVDTVTALWLVEGLQSEPFDPAVDVPTVPTLIVCGTEDGAPELEAVAAGITAATFLPVSGDHGGALMSPEFRTAAVEFVTGAGGSAR